MSEWMNRDNERISEAEATLRMIARLPAPAGLEDRVHAGLRSAPKAAPGPRRVLAWPVLGRGGLMGSAGMNVWMRGAAAAAIVFVVAGGGIGIYSRVQTGAAVQGTSPRLGGFGEGGAVARPKTVQGPVVMPTMATPAVKDAPKVLPKRPVAGAKALSGKRAVVPVTPVAK